VHTKQAQKLRLASANPRSGSNVETGENRLFIGGGSSSFRGIAKASLVTGRSERIFFSLVIGNEQRKVCIRADVNRQLTVSIRTGEITRDSLSRLETRLILQNTV